MLVKCTVSEFHSIEGSVGWRWLTNASAGIGEKWWRLIGLRPVM